jgi:hypothetical protein
LEKILVIKKRRGEDEGENENKRERERERGRDEKGRRPPKVEGLKDG